MKFILLFILTILSCSDISNLKNKNHSQYKRTVSGDYCNENCIWSSYAVNLNVQKPTVECNTGYCACVEIGNIYSSCEIEIEIDKLSENSLENIETAVPYYNQYDNKNYGYATCQNTSIAMVLSYFEYVIHPDNIFQMWGKDIAQSPSGLNQVYSYYAKNSKIETYTNASPDFLKESLQKGYIAIVHGYFTGFGHVLVITKYEDNKYYVNDPAGKWLECFMCGYKDNRKGVTFYKESSLDAAVFTSDGFLYLPGWIHLIKKTD